MFTISKDFHFSASHQLQGLPNDHPCGRLHGHNYVVRFEFQAQQLDENGFVLDFKELDEIKEFIDTHFDHRHLNEVLQNTTSESLAEYLFKWASQKWPQLIAVGVSETPKTWAWYREG